MRKEGSVYIGTSGWMYKDWGDRFYPKELRRGHLAYFAREFNTVEVNTSFYHLPLKSTFKKWTNETPVRFVFAVKLSRYITHQKRLEGARAPLERFFTRARAMDGKLGVILAQLPPSLRFDESVLEKFLEDLRAAQRRTRVASRLALEPRHKSWIEGKNGRLVRDMLRERKIALVFPHSAKIPSFEPEEPNITSDFVYVRFHGPSEFAASRYGKKRLAPWAKRLRRWRGQGLDAFVYFNNDAHGHAIFDARTLKEQTARA